VFSDDAVMLRLPGGVHGLVDCGRAAASWIIPYLEEHKVETFDFIAISHWDADRFRGVTSVVHALRHVGKFLVPSVAGEMNPLVRNVLAYLEISEAIGELQATNDRTVIWELVDSTNRIVRVEAFAADRNDPAIWMVPGRRYMPRNDLCTVFRLSVDDRHFLMTADANVRRWTRLFERQLRPGESLRSDGLTLPRHGSSTSLNKEILHKLADPTGFYAIVDPVPRYGLPHRRVLDLVREENGEIIVCDTTPVHMLLTRDGLFARRFALGSMSQFATPITPRRPEERQKDGSLEL
jgi:beta-lactamase superfamily II metal-dependent hydrolase